MENKTEIEIKKNDIRTLLLIIFVPILLTFGIEHFGKFHYQSYGGQISTLTLSGGSFTTPFGNKVIIEGGQKAYKRHSDGTYKINGYYTDKLPYYFQGLIKDIVYPTILIVVLLLVYFFKHKYSIKIS
ncbi:hypothetical protein [Nonlabens agnitus]|uniref:Uncharacterized protein n=1 Tax=Nonlabens agnitus TaxID=870484 RepID=A0A2S9WSB2_9FLAO|nr:hypothetical protein [Nonlabens agnitus]PRP66373.1 hypothetical protein BST86_04345 [Nonlabens agnitus]